MNDVNDTIELNDMVSFIEHIHLIQDESSDNKPCIYLEGTEFSVAKNQEQIKDENLIVVSSDELKEITNLFQKGTQTQNSDTIYLGIANLMKRLTEYENKKKPKSNDSDG